MRLAKYLAHAGVASRRHAERLITSGRVTVDGRRVTDPARDVGDENEIWVEGVRVTPEAREYHLLNKPQGVVSTAHDPEGRAKVTDLVDSEARLYPVGRLDADSSGLVLLTNDGELANRLMHPRYEIEKAYRVRVRGQPSKAALARLRAGVELEDGRTAPAGVEVVETRERESLLEITVHEGRNRLVRRMLEAVGHPIIELQRTRLGPLALGRLAVGTSRRLRPQEAQKLEQLTGQSPRLSESPR
jgi:23S rRNA pseudouridine2605 synthase